MTERRRKFWGWGWEGEGPTREQQERIAQLLTARFGIDGIEIQTPPALDEIAL
jgi:alkyldihydroxyacetonephosphate synthase